MHLNCIVYVHEITHLYLYVYKLTTVLCLSTRLLYLYIIVYVHEFTLIVYVHEFTLSLHPWDVHEFTLSQA